MSRIMLASVENAIDWAAHRPFQQWTLHRSPLSTAHPLYADSQLSPAHGFPYRINKDKWPIKLPLCSFSFSFTVHGHIRHFSLARSHLSPCSPVAHFLCLWSAYAITYASDNICHVTYGSPVSAALCSEQTVKWNHLWSGRIQFARKLGAQMPSTSLPFINHMCTPHNNSGWCNNLVIDTHSHAHTCVRSETSLLLSISSHKYVYGTLSASAPPPVPFLHWRARSIVKCDNVMRNTRRWRCPQPIEVCLKV